MAKKHMTKYSLSPAINEMVKIQGKRNSHILLVGM
jgi:hypothetical protein